RSDQLPDRARRPDRRSPGEPSGRDRRRAARRPVDARRARERRGAGGGGEGAGGVMIDATVNVPEAVAEVRALFQRCERALLDPHIEVLDAPFWDSPPTVRYGLHERGSGFAAIHAHRVARPPGPGIKGKRIRLEILTLGRDVATVNLEFEVRGRDLV